MKTLLIIIGVLSIVQFLIKLIAIVLIKYLNKQELKDKKPEEINPIYYLSCDKGLITKAEFGEIYFIPTLSAYTEKEEFVITFKWFNITYTIAYYYKRANDF